LSKVKYLPVANYCGCGCGELVFPRSDIRHARFVDGHQKKIPRRPRKSIVKSARGHKIARKLIPRDECKLKHIGGCSTKLEIHHIDKDFNNNSLDNLICLCASHHHLVESGKIDLQDPVMPPYYISPGGQRVYPKGEVQIPRISYSELPDYSANIGASCEDPHGPIPSEG